MNKNFIILATVGIIGMMLAVGFSAYYCSYEIEHPTEAKYIHIFPQTYEEYVQDEFNDNVKAIAKHRGVIIG